MTMKMHRAFSTKMLYEMTLYTISPGTYDSGNNWVEGAVTSSKIKGVITSGNRFSQFDEGIALQAEDGGARFSNFKMLYVHNKYTIKTGDKVAFKGELFNVIQNSDESVFGFLSFMIEKSEDRSVIDEDSITSGNEDLEVVPPPVEPPVVVPPVYVVDNDPFHWKPIGHALFLLGTGQSNMEPGRYPIHPLARPLVKNTNVLVWCSDGNGLNWDFRVADPEWPMFNDYLPYDAIDNPNGRGAEPYCGYPGGGAGSETLGAAIHHQEVTGRKVYFSNFAWAGVSSFQWIPGFSLGDAYGQVAALIAYHMPAMQARLRELEPDLETSCVDHFIFNQGTTDANGAPEYYINNWSGFIDNASSFTLDGYGQKVNTGWIDSDRTFITLIQRTKRDELYPNWNGQELLLEKYRDRMNMVSTKGRKIWDTSGVSGGYHWLDDPSYSLHFWGDEQIDIGRDTARSVHALGAAEAETDVKIVKHNTSTKTIAGTFFYATPILTSSVEATAGTFTTNADGRLVLSHSDVYGNDIELPMLLNGDLVYFIDRTNREAYAYFPVTDVQHTANSTSFLITTIGGGAVAYDLNPGDISFLETSRRIFIGSTYVSADVILSEPFKRMGVGYGPGSMPDATLAVKAHSQEGSAQTLESASTGFTKVWLSTFLREAQSLVEVMASHALRFTSFGQSLIFTLVSRTTGASIDSMKMEHVSGKELPRISLRGSETLLRGTVYGSIVCTNSVVNLTSIATDAPLAQLFTQNGPMNMVGSVLGVGQGRLVSQVGGIYDVNVNIRSATCVGNNKRITCYVRKNSDATKVLQMNMVSNGVGYISPATLTGRLDLSLGDYITVWIVAIDPSPATSLQIAEADFSMKLRDATSI